MKTDIFGTRAKPLGGIFSLGIEIKKTRDYWRVGVGLGFWLIKFTWKKKE